MSSRIIILSTVINTSVDLQCISQVLSTFSSISEWSVDLDDCDKVLRAISSEDIGADLVETLDAAGISAMVLEVFDENGVSIM
nr:hypothetical protein [Pedobacter panaciterrae]